MLVCCIFMTSPLGLAAGPQTLQGGLFTHFLAGLQSNSGLWIDDVRLSVNIWLTLVNLCF